MVKMPRTTPCRSISENDTSRYNDTANHDMIPPLATTTQLTNQGQSQEDHSNPRGTIHAIPSNSVLRARSQPQYGRSPRSSDTSNTYNSLNTIGTSYLSHVQLDQESTHTSHNDLLEDHHPPPPHRGSPNIIPRAIRDNQFHAPEVDGNIEIYVHDSDCRGLSPMERFRLDRRRTSAASSYELVQTRELAVHRVSIRSLMENVDVRFAGGGAEQ